MNENPWTMLPRVAPFVHPDDKPEVIQFNNRVGEGSNRFLQLDVVPEAFVGNREAPVVLLSNNPGYGKQAQMKMTPAFRKRIRNNLLHAPSKHPFVYLDPDPQFQNSWWLRKLRRLIEHFDQDRVANCILNVPYFPYASIRFGHRKVRLPSQNYSFELVRSAIQRGAVIIFMRQDGIWKEAVPTLTGYRRAFKVENVQNPAISPKNCLRGFEAAKAVIERWVGPN